MDVVDDGALGMVNAFKILVILFAATIVVSGFVLVTTLDQEGDAATRFATVEFGAQPVHVADEVSVGDTMPLRDRSGRLTVTDVYRSPAPGDYVMVTVRVRLDGDMMLLERFDEGVLLLAGSHVRSGDELTLETIGYSITGRIMSIDGAGPTLDAEWIPVALQGPERFTGQEGCLTGI